MISLRTVAVGLGMAGAVLVALPVPALRACGFGSWIIGNGLWVRDGIQKKDLHISSQFGFYFVTAAAGLYFVIGEVSI